MCNLYDSPKFSTAGAILAIAQKKMKKRILIIGASGTGTTTLGKRLSTELGIPFIDLDDIFWIDSEIPFTKFRNTEELRMLVNLEIYSKDEWIISGDPSLWNVDIENKISFVIFLEAPTEIRIPRLEKRFNDNYGIESRVDGNLTFENHKEFIDWTKQYDIGGVTGRTREKQESWISKLKCKVYKTNSNKELDLLTNDVVAILAIAHQ